MAILSGYKTYLVAVILALLGVANFLGVQVPGVSMQGDWLMLILNAIGLGGLRAAVAKAEIPPSNNRG